MSVTGPDIQIMPKPRAWRDKVIARAARWVIRPNLALPLPWAMKRRSFAFAGRTRPSAPGVSQQAIKIAGKTGALYLPEAPTARILWIHGGGFVIGSPRSHQGMLSYLARAANAAVIVPKYRRAPEHPFPAAVEDVEAAIDVIDATVPDTGPLILAGDSAGGTLALVALARALAQHTPEIAGVLLVSPAVDLDPDRPVPDADDMLFPLEMFHRIQRFYIRDADPTDPRLSPIHADFTGAPPVLIHCCVGEYLETDSDLLAERLAAQGVRVTVRKYQNLPHVFHFMVGSSPSATAALDDLAAFVRRLGEAP